MALIKGATHRFRPCKMLGQQTKSNKYMTLTTQQENFPTPHVFNLRDAMIACGVKDIDVFLGDTPAFRLATDILGYDFTTCMDKTFVEHDSNFKTYSDLNQAQGQIGLLT